MPAVGYPVWRLLKNYSPEQQKVMVVTEFATPRPHNERVMARRSLGVVLIVALLGWTVNRPILGCEGQHSRAAVVVLAGASPAYQPEPSPTRHSCCPRESQKEAVLVSSSPSGCPHFLSSHADCCSVAKHTLIELSATLVEKSFPGKFVLGSLPSFELTAPHRGHAFAGVRNDSAGIRINSFHILRL
jgi:hypothetical protein